MLLKYFDGRGEKWTDWIEKFLEYGWQQKQLDSGDFRFWTHEEKSVGVEVKSVKDLIDLSHTRKELALLCDQVDIPILMVWGPWERRSNDLILGSGYITMKQVMNLLQSFQNIGLRLDIPCTSRNHAFARVNQLFAYYQKPEESHESTLVRRIGGADRRISLLMGIPGISKELARRLLTTFESLNSIANASQDDLKRSYNIGDSRARIIYNYFHTKESIR